MWVNGRLHAGAVRWMERLGAVVVTVVATEISATTVSWMLRTTARIEE